MKLIAHACGPTIFPSNTIFSAREALKNGADMVELDLQLTLDKKLAVFHDKDLMKKYGLDKRCREVTSQEFLSLRRTVDPACPSHLLEHFFQCGIAPILLHHSHYVVEETLELIEQYDYADRVLFGIGEVRTLLRIREKYPKARVLGFIKNPDDIESFVENGVNYIRLWERWLTRENIRRVKDGGVELWIMTGGPETDFPVGKPDRDSLLRLAALKPDGLLVNDIPFVQSVLSELE
ncbi:MAG: glycerophosphodiester phosphodiesterase [Ruminococcaceae bacterium]|nr:glycerophosphodiester phosphodiesterase [Oscillospiraceae bacterium]